jgi:hypothetical protein
MRPSNTRVPRSVVILSLPFVRLTRVQLGPPVLGSLQQHHDIIVVSPFASDAGFAAEFSGPGIQHLEWKPPSPFHQPLRALFTVSELMRMHGYWRRFRHGRTAWNLANSRTSFGVNGQDQKHSLALQVVETAASIIGLWPRAWRILDWLIGPFVFNFKALRDKTAPYDCVTVIQSASWGIQDRMMAWMAKQHRWRTVLVPYTTDQLLCNGYLMTDFDAVCTQGPTEQTFAIEQHGLPASRLVQLGSAWFRHMDLIATRVRSQETERPGPGPKTLMFAGVSPLYFPRESEVAALDCLVAAIDAGRLGHVEVIYRPIVLDDGERTALVDRYRRHQWIRIQWPQNSSLGIDTYGDRRMDDELTEYVSQLCQVDLLVTAGVTSLTVDAANLGVVAMCIVADRTGVLARRNNNLLLNADGTFKDFGALRLIHDLNDLIPAVEQLLNDRDKATSVARELASGWDFAGVDFPGTLLRAIQGR